MIDFNEPLLADKKRADDIFQNGDYRANDYCFGNLFIWRKKSDTKLAFHKGFVIVSFKSGGKNMYLYPAGKGDRAEVLRDMRQDAFEHGSSLTIACLTPLMREELEAIAPGGFEYTPDRRIYDYIYNTTDLIDLKGRKYHSKRNHITRFKALGEWSYEDMGPINVQECREMNDQWCMENGCGEDMGLQEEYGAVRQALKNFEALGFAGGILRLYGKIVAFTLGERLCSDTFDVHIEKAFSRVDGAYTTINNEFVSHNCKLYRYVNREEDTGDEGLRKAKLSYQPAILLEKSIAVLKEGFAL